LAPTTRARIVAVDTALTGAAGEAAVAVAVVIVVVLMMVSVLLRLRPSGLLDEFPNCLSCPRRSTAAYEQDFAAQWAINAGHSQAG
jgi:hypothetical protein